jgi:hypothetical protein
MTFEGRIQHGNEIGGYLSSEFSFDVSQKLKNFASKSQQRTMAKLIISPNGTRKIDYHRKIQIKTRNASQIQNAWIKSE